MDGAAAAPDYTESPRRSARVRAKPARKASDVLNHYDNNFEEPVATRKRRRTKTYRKRKGGEQPIYPEAQRHHMTREEYKKCLFRAYDDKDGHYRFQIGCSLTTKTRNYQILSTCGEGTFGRVARCVNRNTGELVAVKIVKSIQKYRDAAKSEIKILQDLMRLDPESTKHCVKLLDSFDFRNHICLVFPLLGLSLYDHMKRSNFRAFSLSEVSCVGRQLLDAVSFLHHHKLAHTDIKPENIMLVQQPRYTGSNPQYELESLDIILIDFGSAAYTYEPLSYVVSTRHYRAPEVILGLGWSTPCDIWSIGCVLVELYRGRTLFQTHDCHEHLALMQVVLGRIPFSLARETLKPFFSDSFMLLQPDSFRPPSNCVPLMKMALEESNAHFSFLRMIAGLLKYDAYHRFTAEDALAHDFFGPATDESAYSDVTQTVGSDSDSGLGEVAQLPDDDDMFPPVFPDPDLASGLLAAAALPFFLGPGGLAAGMGAPPRPFDWRLYDTTPKNPLYF